MLDRQLIIRDCWTCFIHDLTKETIRRWDQLLPAKWGILERYPNGSQCRPHARVYVCARTQAANASRIWTRQTLRIVFTLRWCVLAGKHGEIE